MTENEIPISFKWYLNRQGIQGQQGERGEEGFSPTITVNENSLTTYTLKVQNKTESFVTPNLRQVVADSGGTYVRYDRTTGNLYAGNPDFATTTQSGIVRFCTEEELSDAYDGSVVSPADLKEYIDNNLNMPIASSSTLGLIKVGKNLTITPDGTLNATGGSSIENIKDITNGIQIMGLEEVPPTGIFDRGYFQFTTETIGSSVDYTAQFIRESWENGVLAGKVILNFLTDNSVTAGEGITITKKNTGVEISSTVGNLKYSTLTSTEYSELTPNSDTMYRLTDTNEVYLGTIKLTGGGSITPSMYAGIPAGGQNTGYIGKNTVTVRDIEPTT